MLITAGTLVFLLLGALAHLRFGDLSVHKDHILSAASVATGFDIIIDGPFSLDGGRKITLHAGDARIANPGWPDGPVLATLGDLQIVVDTWSVVSGPLEFDLIELDASAVMLQEKSDGTANWTLAAPPSDLLPDEGDSPETDISSPDNQGFSAGPETGGQNAWPN